MQFIIPVNVKNIIDKLQDNGYEAYAVGGCVRDTCLGLKPHDWDITTSALPHQVKELFRRTIDVGIEHGTVVIMIGDEGYEVTTYRIDGEYEDNRHPKEVTFTNSLSEDLRRRDFTINAMAYSDKTGIIDLFHGREDLDKKIIRAVGEPRERFTEDALRILRAIRFAARFGYEIEDNTKEAIKELAPNLAHISAERIREELEKTICSPNPDFLRLAYELGVTKVILPEFDEMMECAQNSPYHIYSVGEHTIKAILSLEDLDKNLSEKDKATLRIATLLHDVGKPKMKFTDEKGVDHFMGHPQEGAKMAKEILRRLKYDNKTIDTVCKLVRYHDCRPELTLPNVRRAIVKIGMENMELMILLKKVDLMAQSNYREVEKKGLLNGFIDLYHEISKAEDCLSIKDLAINGKDLIALGVKPGPTMGEILDQLLEMVLDDPNKNQEDILKNITLQLING